MAVLLSIASPVVTAGVEEDFHLVENLLLSLADAECGIASSDESHIVP